MKAFFDERQLGHKPEVYYRGGAPMPHPEQPQRAILIRDMLLANGFPVEAPGDFGLGPIKAVHDPAYVDFFADAYHGSWPRHPKARWESRRATPARGAGGVPPISTARWAGG